MLAAASWGQVRPANQTSRAAARPAIVSIAESIPPTVIRSAERKTFIERRKYAAKSEAIIRKVGGISNPRAIIAMLANAWHECRFDPTASSAGNVGFYQLNVRGGLGRGHSVQNLKDVEYNTKAIINTNDFRNWKAWVEKNPNASAGTMSYRFAAYVERCAKQHRAPRRTTADNWYSAWSKTKR
jgi:hypothetical protein